MQSALESPSTRPYLLRAMFEWCVDSGFTPYVAVMADETVQVPPEFIKDGQVVLNIGPDATNGLLIGNELIEFKARFAGVVREILVPVDRVMAIYARENGQGMAFPVPTEVSSGSEADSIRGDSEKKSASGLRLASAEPAISDESTQSSDGSDVPPDTPPPPGRPSLKRVK